LILLKEGWLATGNSNSMVSCTFTTCLNEKQQEHARIKYERLRKAMDLAAAAPTTSDASTTTTTTSAQSTTQQPPAPTPTSPTPAAVAAETSNSSSNFTRTNFNLRGHKADVKLVRWNEPYQKLATCDAKGAIYVWIRYEGRWSIELINDRGHPASDFSWSHDGRMAVITYLDGFVLVGSVNGQRYWSHMYDLAASKSITCATWAPNDTFILLGISDGSVMMLDENGTMTGTHVVKSDLLLSLAFNCPKFFIDELISINNATLAAANNNANNSSGSISSPRNNRARLSSNLFQFSNNDNNNNNNNNNNNQINNRVDSKLKNKVSNGQFMLACSFKTGGVVYLMKSHEDVDPIVIETGLEGLRFEWASSGQFLAVGGYETGKVGRGGATDRTNYVHFYNTSGVLIYKLKIPSIVIIIFFYFSYSLTGSRFKKKFYFEFGPIVVLKFTVLTLINVK
jgi:hypothetical protein